MYIISIMPQAAISIIIWFANFWPTWHVKSIKNSNHKKYFGLQTSFKHFFFA